MHKNEKKNMPHIDWEKIIEWDKKYYMHNFFTAEEWMPLPISKAEGCYVYDEKGNKILDFMAQLHSANMGHRHPKIIEGIKKSLDEYGHLWEVFVSNYRAEAAKLILEDLLGKDNWAGRVKFVVTGTEAVEMSLLHARFYTGAMNIITRDWDYHGWMSTSPTRMVRSLAVYASPKTTEVKSYASPPIHGLYVAPEPYCYRCPLGHDYESCKKGILPCIRAVENIIEFAGAENIAGVITETILGAGGVLAPPPEYIPQLRKITREKGVIWIDDEVICGFGRTGKWFSYQHWAPEVKPDIMTIGKGMNSSQLPSGGVVFSKKITDYFDQYRCWLVGTHFAHPVLMASVVACIKAMMEEKIVDRVPRLGEYLGKRLKELEEKHGCVGQVSGMGLLWGIEIVKDKKTKEPFVKEDRYSKFAGDISKVPSSIIFEECLKKGVICGGYAPNSVRIGPPLIITEKEIDEGVEALDHALGVIDKMCIS